MMPEWTTGDVVRRTVNPAVALDWTVIDVGPLTTFMRRGLAMSIEANCHLELVSGPVDVPRKPGAELVIAHA
jgi:hypothetical protein